ncbi:MAG: DUF4372 domain-containing protein [Proteobacteria bacterium]|nr:DUF4372 domain-containing protein [Pseudomonadota bacterium]MBU4383905.1 DUF4372 domain-containing protein [Pseudomonadota bacterium]MBU4603833.1 DUF4372 domain-containing protein [Pseudomonadota bacterium]
MVRSVSLFSQLLKQIPRPLFAGLASRHKAERNAKGFTSQDWQIVNNILANNS